ncbi:peptide chain release factor 3 [Alkaliphilus metalliredigens QYMF]|uniref:Peptide chain release factor 3 n=1 Tax=Alkaliphilus metalliredigens (strain QYMF) TaxID=293826 RepID=A6TUE4_ALKMQ|nr:peptide chain release factor 3 [Alkaliphilus metalliredigens]ABR49812.1 peptide chain release factor 3 [Alkaliphilus metalliredigens QYMF]
MSQKQVNFLDEVRRRRNFAIISHPDAGKTTLTEKLLLYGGAIRLAGSVKSRRAQKHAVSDWMEIEKQRGISVTSSVLQFGYDGYCVNILDTPGHQDFSEDTYRTLMAADSAVMVIDCAKGVEAQTKKLFQVCKMRGIPIFTFVNKLDRAGKDPFELMEEIENVLGIRSYPMNWPIGTDGNFKGIYNRDKSQVELFHGGNHGQNVVKSTVGDASDEKFKGLLGTEMYEQLQEEIELLDTAGDEFDLEKIAKGELTPMFFGSAMTNFGVQPFLESFLKLTKPPTPRVSNAGEVDPESKNFTGFVFKIQANMNPAHRDRLAFIRICSGEFVKSMEVNHVRHNKKVKLSQPQQFLAQERAVVERAYPGDIIGIHDPGIFKIGDTLCEDDSKIQYEGIPVFSPEHFAKIYAKDSMKRKHFIKGITQLAEEGAIQVYKELNIGTEEIIVGVVGALQFEVLEYRLKNEYNVNILMQQLPFKHVRWIEMDGFDSDRFKGTTDTLIVNDEDDKPVILFQNEWSIQRVLDRNEGAVLKEISARSFK